MDTKKVVLFFITITILGTIIFFATPSQSSSIAPSVRLENEYEIYNLLLMEELANNGAKLPIADFTSLGPLNKDIVETDIPLIIPGFPVVKREAYLDLREQNQHSYLIKDYLPETINNEVTSSRNWWFSFSRIGFDSSLTQALVVKEKHIGCESDGFCYRVEGWLLFLQKVNDTWIVKDEPIYWEQLTKDG